MNLRKLLKSERDNPKSPVSKGSFNSTIAYILIVLDFPLNPLILTGVVQPLWDIKLLTIAGWIVWGIGMVFVIYPFFYLKAKGKVAKGKSYVSTNRVVATGLYGVVRHVQYLGGILTTFFATPLLYQHWIFVLIAIPGLYFSKKMTEEEDVYLIAKFGNKYKEYMKRVPGLNIIKGLYRTIHSPKV